MRRPVSLFKFRWLPRNDPPYAFIALIGLNEAAAQDAAQPAAAPPCALPAVADSVALNPVPGSDLVTVPVEINGKPKQFLLDVSTNPTEVSQATVAELGLPENEKLTSSFQTGGTGGMSNMGSQQAMQLQAPVLDVKGNQVAYAMRTLVRIGFVEEFIRERPLVAVAIAVMAGALLIRRLFATRPDATK